ncbi:hypothetical protein HK097_001477, partial [Rhizophlyctis rosea]
MSIFSKKVPESPPVGTSGDFRDFRVAIVDDNQVVQKITTKSLKKFFGVNVTEDDIYNDGLALLQALEIKRYDIIMMDIQMPILNGWEATKLIRGYTNTTEENDALTSQLALDAATISKNLASLSMAAPSTPTTMRRKSPPPLSPSAGMAPSPSGMSFSPSSVTDSFASLPVTLNRPPEPRRRRASSISGGPRNTRNRLSIGASAALGSLAPGETPETIGSRILAENRLVPIIAITDNASQELRDKYINAGMNEVLAKPLTPGVIQTIFGKYLTTQEHRQIIEDTDFARRVSAASGGGTVGRGASGRSGLEVPGLGMSGSMTVSGLDLASPIPPPDEVVERDGKAYIILRAGTVIAGVPDALLEYFLDVRKGGAAYQRIFLLTFRSFITPANLLTWLRQRFNRTLPPNPTIDQVREYAASRGTEQLNVIKVLQLWIDFKWHDYENDPTLRANLETFLDQILRANYVEQVTDLRMLIDKQSKKHLARLTQMQTLMDPQNLIPRSAAESLLTSDVDELKLAQQLCLYNSMLFRHIPPIDFLNMIWKKPSPALTFFIQRFDKESYWVATEIVSRRDLKARREVVKTFLNVAKQSLEYQNFFSVFAIMSGFNLTPVMRLKKTWEALSTDKKKILADLERVTDVSRNFKNYRDLLEQSKPPMIPFLRKCHSPFPHSQSHSRSPSHRLTPPVHPPAIFIKDLTFMNDGNPSQIDGRINFDKLRLMGECVRGITALASLEYKFWNFDPDMQEYLTNPPLEKDIGVLTGWSLEGEPRE